MNCLLAGLPGIQIRSPGQVDRGLDHNHNPSSIIRTRELCSSLTPLAVGAKDLLELWGDCPGTHARTQRKYCGMSRLNYAAASASNHECAEYRIQGSKVESSGSEQSEQTGHACMLIWCRFGVDSWSRPSETTRGGRALRRNAKGASPPPETGSLMYVVLEGSTKAWLGRLCNSQGWVHGDRALGNGTRVHLLSTPVPTPPSDTQREVPSG